MKILYAASMARPFVATGGLADIAESLPKALNKKKGVDCRVVIPLYSKIPDTLRLKMKYLTNFNVCLSWRNLYCGIFEAEHNGVTYYFIDNEQYFKRDELHGYPDDGERFAFFSLAILEMLPHIDFKPDIINANDWHTALVPIYRQTFHAYNEFYSDIKTVFTIHNISFQGIYDYNMLYDIFALPPWSGSIVKYTGMINLVKGAIETAHAVTTVSPTYADEIAGLRPDPSGYDFGKGLTTFISERNWKLTGILNGIEADPMNDRDVYVNYGISDVKEGKTQNKLQLQKRLGLLERSDVPLVSTVTRIDSQQKGCQHIIEAIDGGLLDDNDIQFIMLGSADPNDIDGKKMEDRFRELEIKYKGKMVSYIGFLPELSQKIYAGSDIFLMPSLYEPCGLSQMISMKFGTIPVVRQTGGLNDTVTDNQSGTGNGFTYKHYDSLDFRKAIERSLLAYADADGWNELVTRAMECDFSWDTSVIEYIELYRRLLSE